MPVKIDMTSIEFSAIAQMEKDYKILYEALERIAEMPYISYRARVAAQMALNKVTIKP